MLAQANLLILDEPTNGLDPEGIAEVRQLIRDIAAQEKTILIASHLLDEVQKVCTDFCILRQGVKLYEGKVSEIIGETNRVEIASSDLKTLESSIKDLRGLMGVSIENGSLTLELDDSIGSTEINRYCFDKGITLTKLVTQKNSLEEEFLKILKEHDYYNSDTPTPITAETQIP